MLAPWTCFCPPPKKPGTRQESLINIAVRKVAHPGDCKADLPRDPYLHYANANGNIMSVLLSVRFLGNTFGDSNIISWPIPPPLAYPADKEEYCGSSPSSTVPQIVADEFRAGRLSPEVAHRFFNTIRALIAFLPSEI
ncbi:hypothetical protein B0H14DRAFT_3521149 [Mycena olivaceomarginata]|nr:hypothetical protein B0H14DRAFT_3521149 [Mycena olivaceomarginata]